MARKQESNTTHLYRHYYDEEALRAYALEEFTKGARRGRMIAFIGSMATEKHGYPDWPKLLQMGVEAARRLFTDDDQQKALTKFAKPMLAATRANTFDGRAMSSALGGWIDHKTARTDSGANVNIELANLLLANAPNAVPPNDQNMIHAAIKSLGIKRFVTTNYDMEIEYDLLSITDGTIKARQNTLNTQFGFEPDKPERRPTQLRMPMEDGNILVSDAFQRERLDRLVEFAVRSVEVDFHVLHLHGRLDKPETMIVSYRDYDRLYRLNGPSKLPFEQALTMLYTANPVLFIGLGMREAELNNALEELVGNQPYRRAGQTFLLWSAPTKPKCVGSGAVYPPDVYDGEPVLEVDAEAKAMFRLDKLHRLGVLTIFDDELGGDVGDVVNEEYREKRVTSAINALAAKVLQTGNDRLTKIPPADWRDVEFKRDIRQEPPLFTWHFARPYPAANIGEAISVTTPLLLAKTARPGTGKSGKATATIRRWCYGDQGTTINPERKALFINTSLRLDTDAVLELICKFLHTHAGAGNKPYPRKGTVPKSREELFRDTRIFQSDRNELLIVFKGLERLFSKTGEPLSAEFDRFFRDYLAAAIEHKFPSALATAENCEATREPRFCRIVVYGTRRMRTYFTALKQQVERDSKVVERTQNVIDVERTDEDPSGYLIRLQEQMLDQLAREPILPPLAGDRAFARETYRNFFENDAFTKKFRKGSQQEKLAFAILTVAAFIGQPVEREVLFHAPRVTNCLIPRKNSTWAAKVNSAVNKLIALKLLHVIARPYFKGTVKSARAKDHRERLALHLSLQAEMRERYGVPLSEAVLSTSFNMSLYAAQPSDSAMPDPSGHDELGKLIDWMIGAHKDEVVYNPKDVAEEKWKRTPFHVSACLRTALALLRGFYSTSALLTIDRDDRLVNDLRDGALTEHADRIERLIRAFEATRAQRAERREDLLGKGETYEDVKDLLGPEPFYPDELVWLHNERGVVKLAQGDLYEARFSLNEADRINRDHVEFKDRSHNWRRIWLNQVVVDIERGKLAEAEDRLGRIENSVGRQKGNEEARMIRVSLGGHDATVSNLPLLEVTHEDQLAISLATGYRALIMQLRGELNTADQWFEKAITMLEKLDEQRACALFRRHHASLKHSISGNAEMAKVARLSVAGAESVQQMDIAYSARIARNNLNAESDKAEDRRKAMRIFSDALEYATVTDVHRVAIDARKALARLKLANGDFESALEHAWQGMALAARYGMSLHKIALRILIGEILFARDNREAGSTLIKSAIREADRMGYQRAVESAQSALANISGW